MDLSDLIHQIKPQPISCIIVLISGAVRLIKSFPNSRQILLGNSDSVVPDLKNNFRSRHRFGDIVLHDGASLGVVRVGEQEFQVFNELLRLRPSRLQTFIAEVTCDDPDQFQELLDVLSELGEAEDWTENKWICASCARGDQEGAQAQHEHDESELAWVPDREIAVAAETQDAVARVLATWEEKEGRRVHTLTPVEPEVISGPEDGTFWWEARP